MKITRAGAATLFTVAASAVFANTSAAQTVGDTLVRIRGVRSSAPIQVSSDYHKFHPAVAAVDSGGECGPVVPSPSGPGMRNFFYSIRANGVTTRSVVVIVDSLNQLQHYSDIRGDLRGPGDSSIDPSNPMGPRTVLTYNATAKFGTLMNEHTAEPAVRYRVDGPDFLLAPDLGVPMRMLELVLLKCGKR